MTKDSIKVMNTGILKATTQDINPIHNIASCVYYILYFASCVYYSPITYPYIVYIHIISTTDNSEKL
jgi:hypothetical protein